LEIIVKNLIDNAIKYSEAPAQVKVEGRIDDKGQLTLSVQDQGIGMETRDLKRVFQRFYRSPNAGVRERKGTGLGLYVVYALVKQMGGTISAESTGLKRGTTMRVTIPDVSFR
jgi:signal transduction histidine kinase